MTSMSVPLALGYFSLFMVCFALGFCLRQQLIKVSKMERVCDSLVSALESIQEIIFEANQTLDQSPNLKIAFENDDETGIYFSELQKIQKQLNQFLKDEQETSSGEQS